MGVRSSSGSSSSSRRAQPAPGKRAPERSSGGAACPPGAAAAASAGARPGRSTASALRPWPWPLPSASGALRAPSLPAECLARPLPLEGPHRVPPLRCPGAAPASPRLGPRGTLRRVPPAPPNPSFYAGPGRAATRPPCLLWTSLRAPPAQPVAQRCWDPGEKAPGNERPQRRTAAPAPRVGWVCTGARGRSAGRCARPLPCEIAHCSAGCARPTPSKAPLSPAPEPCVRRARSRPGLGASRGVLREAARCWAPSGLPARGKCRFSPRLSGEPRVSRRGWLRCPPACSSPYPGGARSWGLRSPGYTSRRGDPNSLLRASFSQDSKPAAAAAAARPAALLSRLPGPPRAPGELGQRPRDAGAAGLRAPAPQLAGPTAPGGRGGGGGRCALLETRC